MSFGLKDSDLNEITEILNNYPEIYKAVIFGSRAMDSYKAGSDIDIALFGSLNSKIVNQIQTRLDEETKVPFFFDVLDYNSIQEPALKTHIDKHGKILFTHQ